MLVLSSPVKVQKKKKKKREKKRPARNVVDVFDTHFGLVRDVSDTDYWAGRGGGSGGEGGRIFTTFKRQFVRVRTRNSASSRTFCVSLLFSSYRCSL